MGRAQPSYAPIAQQGFRKDQRAKHARVIITKTIPQILNSDARARKGVANAELISHPPGVKSRSKKATRRASQGADDSSQTSPNQDSASPSLELRIHVADTLVVAQDLHHSSRSKKNVAVLNMASPLRPGGGVLNGATSQEELLCTRTTLLPSLKEEWYRLPELGGIWSPDALVFRLQEETLPKARRFYVDVISAGMLRFPDLTEHGCYASQKDRDLAREKIRRVLQILVEKKADRVVLGAWGCGAYGNPVHEIAQAWRYALRGECGNFNQVVFAIKDSRMAREFAGAWGDEIEVMEDGKGMASAGESEEDREREELLQKIETLESQIKEVKTPMLKESLEGTLRALRMELAKANQDASDDEEDSS
ncbi:uncharacterized protein MYCFIDRAFT_156764 [Pseudocercospora fijiensis CIRAD86]|uniref:Microbial-type PARG catalytic domain-containing protein n=1 Tax=Pseudocercospora fijiensis (strain CIRAD86) TaxID=383855 RepID=M3APU4_PSEFD|nr:uncharacterized protein MYCFIDRAFT_156764 [Pseudocercospora fijiensis CIRAD86]EME79467.1 hypothetical protein MYCFIDRAFT_156764 [Pseudocercospora fijiensis CIRAD86]